LAASLASTGALSYELAARRLNQTTAGFVVNLKLRVDVV
jgi:hypothetical protein